LVSDIPAGDGKTANLFFTVQGRARNSEIREGIDDKKERFYGETVKL
jgi:hypothetical protein